MDKKIKQVISTITYTGLTPYVSEVREYDERGNLVLEEEYADQGTLQNRTRSVFDEHNRLIEQTQIIEGEELADQKIFVRNEQGDITLTEVRYPDGSLSRIRQETDTEALTETLVEEDEDGELESREVNYYNQNKQLIAREIYDFSDKLTEAFTFEYDPNGHLIRRDQLDKRKKLILYTAYQYDDQGRTIRRTNFNRKGKVSDYLLIQYNEAGQVVRQDFSGQFYFTFAYDADGRTVLEERYQAGGEREYQIRFEYSAEGELIRESTDEQVKEIQYTYY